MKRVNITTLTIGLVSLVILLIATMIAQCISGKEGFAGGGKPAKFFSGASMKKGEGPNYRLDSDLKTDDGQPMFDVPIAKPLEGETNEDYYKRLGTIKKGFRGYSFATFEDNTWYDLYYESGGNRYSASGGIGANSNLLETGFNLGNPNTFSNWDTKYPLRIVMDYVRSDGTKYSSTYYFYDGIFTYDWPPPSTAAKPIFDPDNRGQDDEKEGEIISTGSISQIGDTVGPGMGGASDPGWGVDMGGPGMGGPGMGGYDMGGYGMGGYDMGGHGMGGPGRKRPIIINVNNTGGAYAPMEQHPMGDHGHHGHPSSNVTYTHELSEDAEKKLTKTMNFMEFVVKKSQT